MFKSC